MKTTRLFISLILVVAWILLPSRVESESFVDFYGGAAFTMKNDVDVNASGGGFSLVGKFNDVKLENSFLLGLRTGRWLERIENLGVAIDAFYFQPNVKSQTTTFSGTGAVAVGNDVTVASGSAQAQLRELDLKVFAASADVMLRLLPPDRTPTTLGELHAYVLAGPAVFYSDLEGDSDVSFGFKAGAGLVWMFDPHFGLFVEYRFTHFEPDLELKSGGVRMKLDSDISTHHVVAGLSYRF